MEDLQQAMSLLSALDMNVVLWVAIGIAILFLVVILFDSVRRRRKPSRLSSRSGHSISFSPVHYFKRARFLYQSLDSELARRRRHAERRQDHRSKWKKWF